MKKKLLHFTAVLLLAVCFGCDDPPPNPGFRVSTFIERLNPITIRPEEIPYYGVSISGDLVRRSPDATGSRVEFSGNSGNNGYVDAADRVAPGVWNIGFREGPCALDYIDLVIDPGEDRGITCHTVPENDTWFFTVDPSFVDLDYPPAYMSIYGSGMAAGGGMPTVEYWNSVGQFVASAQATDVAPDGTWLRGPAPNPSQVYPGRFLLRIKNSAGEHVGSGVVDVYRYEEPPPPPPECPPCPPPGCPACDCEVCY